MATMIVMWTFLQGLASLPDLKGGSWIRLFQLNGARYQSRNLPLLLSIYILKDPFMETFTWAIFFSRCPQTLIGYQPESYMKIMGH